ncbi:hypothetical protein [Nocardiopsis metallicus]|uniref:Uncharacterized protein n=1 Tax=Nocardiopsis metallicus TaxID=179819 RepID=A0A840VZB1_9ACTN|nr:hypothetical protein [Nocardiopsis metallicus]MBB5489054.1 hypothetical protein [Nocardiopsis metallicus]
MVPEKFEEMKGMSSGMLCDLALRLTKDGDTERAGIIASMAVVKSNVELKDLMDRRLKDIRDK